MNEELIKKRAQFFLDNNQPVHIQTNKITWYNGYITDVRSDFIMINDFKLGEMPVFFMEIVTVDKYTDNSELNKEEVGVDVDK